MIGNNSISEFSNFLFVHRVREITVIEYRRRGGVWNRKRGRILSHPEFHYRPWTCVRIKLHHCDVDSSDLGLRRLGETSEMFFSCWEDEYISLDVTDTQATLHGFTTVRGDRVDIVAHMPIR